MKALMWFFAGLGVAATLGQLARWRQQRVASGLIDLNAITREQLLRVPGMEADWADRIIDNRPYRSKFDLLNRLVIPDDVYRQFRHRFAVDDKSAHAAIRTA
jgi:predicted DNA-binding helix-hairpin-helix protein